MSPSTSSAIASHVPQPALHAIVEAATSHISLLPRDATDLSRISVPGTSRLQLSAIQPPTDEEIEAALADARASDPSGQNDDFYYHGYRSREDLARDSVAPIESRGERQDEYDNEPRLYYHSVDNTWRVFPPQFDFPEVSDDEDEMAKDTTGGERKRDKLKRLGVQLFKRISTLRRKDRRG